MSTRITSAVIFCVLSVIAATARAQQTTMTVVANPGSIAYGESTIVTATVSVTGGSSAGLAGYPIYFYTPLNEYTSSLSSAGTASFTFNALDMNDATTITVGANFPGGSLNNNYFQGSSGSVNITILPGTSLLTGPYTFSFEGTGAAGSGPGDAIGAVGSLVADGNGKITGELDINSRNGAYFLPVKGTYVIPTSSAQGTMTLETSLGVQHFDLFALLQPGTHAAVIVPTDKAELFGAATLTPQSSVVASSTAFLGDYVVEELGETACANCQADGHPAGLVTGGGSLRIGYDPQQFVSETLDQNVGNAVEMFSLSGVPWAEPDAMGRFTFQLAGGSGAPADQPVHYAGYIVDSSHIRILSIDSHATAMLLTATGSR